MKTLLSANLQHLVLAIVLVLALAATVVLELAHADVPPMLQFLDSAGAGALFGVTVPGSAKTPEV